LRQTGRMTRRPPLLTAMLALLLLLQWGQSFAHCLAALGAAGGIAICTAEGIRLVHVDAEGQPTDPPQAMHDSCPVCPGGVAPAPPAPQLPALRIAYAPAPYAGREGMPPAPARAPPQQPRAPPAA
jgi:hypothetical protein